MMRPSTEPSTRSAAWMLALCLLLATRVPALVEPVGADQNLYLYAGETINRGGVPYVDAWDQKPPAVFFLYAALWHVWPHPSVVAGADLVAAALTAWLLVVVGRRRFSARVGFGAAVLFLLLGHPALTRLGGVYVRGQCETFMALAVVASIALLARERRLRWHLVSAGAWLGLAFWLKYNGVAYGLAAATALWAWSNDATRVRTWLVDALWLATGFAAVALAFVLWFAAHGALVDLWLATVTFNLQYSGETYHGAASALAYVFELPFYQARAEMIWFLGGLGAVLLLARRRPDRSTWVVLTWIAAAVISIAINGARSLPQYFVQAAPALALAAAAGLATTARRPMLFRSTVSAIIALGLIRVGLETGGWADVRLGGLPGLASNVAFDVRHALGGVDRETYLARFSGAQKYNAAAVADLADLVTATTQPDDPILVFGFAPGIYVDSHRFSASRFFWSRPVVIGFEDGRPGYGTAGLLADLTARPPVFVALQKQDWHLESEPDSEPNSIDFFMHTPALADWLRAGYTLERDTPAFAVWRRRMGP